ncbi:DNA polymerase IV [Secundilactobacillus pentosiphilus]|uniref:DNA polymerase IV n=1 Tax=Secundilactobacillus pentosiphilus TaxID=1714682 RepID=UPI0021E9064A|nr:DNA polymerase IV [Secundilactobacillus pentosiphilus]
MLDNPVHIDDSRRILHVDMDAFYASIEQRDTPAYQKMPLVISRDPRKTGGRGVVTTANYVARKFGVHSAMPAQQALKLCPKAIFVTPNFHHYRAVSDRIHQIFHEYTDIIETVAFDEAYLDVTKNKLDLQDPVELAVRLQAEIWDQTHLTSSIGISYSKFLAKEASDYRKPVGITIIHAEDAHDFLMQLPIERFRGVGKKTVPKMHDLNIQTGQDLLAWDELDLINKFGRFGEILYQRVRGADDRPVEYQRERKSIGNETTYWPFLTTRSAVDTQLDKLASILAQAVKKQQMHGRTLVLKVRYGDFKTKTKRVTQPDFLENEPQLYAQTAKEIMNTLPANSEGVRLLGITLTGLAPITFENIALDLFEDEQRRQFHGD